MPEGLTKEAIDRICELMARNRMIEAIKALRMVWPFGLKEAKDFLDPFRDNPEDLRKKLMEMADIKEGAVFENHFLRIELKREDASFRNSHDFLMEVLDNLYPNPSLDESGAAFIHAARRFATKASFDEMNKLCGELMDMATRKELTVGITKI